jgi:polycomb protein EED
MAHKMAQESGRSKDLGKTKFTYVSKASVGKTPLFGVKFHPNVDGAYFATAGDNQVTVYQCAEDGTIKPEHSFVDGDPEEIFYCVEWTSDVRTKEALLIVAGAKGVIRIINTVNYTTIKDYTGHGSAVNELRIHPENPSLLLSASKDHTLRLWNLSTDTCVLLLSGVDGHRDEVLSCDFKYDGTKVFSAGMDHAVKIWDIGTEEVQEIITSSFTHTPSEKKNFPTLRIHFPILSSREVHSNYVDCIRSFGDLVVSKACENKIVFWQPIPRPEQYTMRHEVFPRVAQCLHEIEVPHCDMWYMRFRLFKGSLLAMGTVHGKIYLWNMVNFTRGNPKDVKPTILSVNHCTSLIRQVDLSPNGKHLIAVSDSGEVWRWDRAP